MAGRGPAPKDPRDRVRHGGRNQIPWTVVTAPPAPQPALPEKMPNGDDWPEQTRLWWQMWARSRLTRGFCDLDWSDLLDCAVLHGMFWNGYTKASGELRLRLAKHGATKADRAKLRTIAAHPVVKPQWDVVSQQWL
jgi:hypothetical protein